MWNLIEFLGIKSQSKKTSVEGKCHILCWGRGLKVSDVNDFCVVDKKSAGGTTRVLLVTIIGLVVLIIGVILIVFIKKFCISKCSVLLWRQFASSSIEDMKAKCFHFSLFFFYVFNSEFRGGCFKVSLSGQYHSFKISVFNNLRVIRGLSKRKQHGNYPNPGQEM